MGAVARPAADHWTPASVKSIRTIHFPFVASFHRKVPAGVICDLQRRLGDSSPGKIIPPINTCVNKCCICTAIFSSNTVYTHLFPLTPARCALQGIWGLAGLGPAPSRNGSPLRPELGSSRIFPGPAVVLVLWGPLWEFKPVKSKTSVWQERPAGGLLRGQ